MNTAMLWVFWLSAAALVYAQVGYVLLLSIASRILRWPVCRNPIRPSVSLIVPVHNGDSLILGKLKNLFSLDYPADRLEIIVIDDCSTDSTSAKVASMCASHASMPDVGYLRRCPSIRFVSLHNRSGKAAALNIGLKVASGDIVGFTDVAAMLENDALVDAVGLFSDPTVGCVSSEDFVVSAGGVGASEGFYSHLDTLARRYESVICCATGCNGSFYLARRELCPQFPLDVATDMFSALHCVSRGYRVVVEPKSKVKLAAQPTACREFERKVRTMVTGLRTIRCFLSLFNPLSTGLYSFFLASHKLVRYLTPIFVTLVLVSSGCLAISSNAFLALFYAEIGALCIGILQIIIQKYTRLSGIAGAPAFFCASVAAAAAGWYRYFTGKRYETWQPTKRGAV